MYVLLCSWAAAFDGPVPTSDAATDWAAAHRAGRAGQAQSAQGHQGVPWVQGPKVHQLTFLIFSLFFRHIFIKLNFGCALVSHKRYSEMFFFHPPFLVGLFQYLIISVLRIRIRDPVPFWPLDPDKGSEIGLFRIPDLGSRIPNPYFLELNDISLGKKFYNSLKTGQNFFSSAFQK